MSLAPRRKRDKVREILGLRPRTPQPSESSGKLQPVVQNPITAQIPSVLPGKVFARGESFKKDMANLSITYMLQESPELKALIQLIVVIRDKDMEGQLAHILEKCARFSVQLASAPDAHHSEASQAMVSLYETLTKLKNIQSDGNEKPTDGLTSMINKDIDEIKPSFIGNEGLKRAEGLSKILDVTMGPTIDTLNMFKNASSFIPVPWVQPLIGTVVNMLQAVSQTRTNYKQMQEIAAAAGEFVVSCAVICSTSTVGPALETSLHKFSKTLRSIAEECDALRQINLFSRYVHQSGHTGDLQGMRKRLDDAIQVFQTENSINIKLDIEQMNRNIDYTALSNLPNHPRYTRNEYLEKSRDDVVEYLSDWTATALEPVLWLHGTAGLGKSTVAQEFLRLLKSEDHLAGGVFLTNLVSEPPETVIQMISRQLGELYPQAVAGIAEAARKLQGPHNSLRDYFTAYIFDPIRGLNYPYPLVIVVDGLDEWRNHESFLAELTHIPSPSPVKFILTSRFSYSIERAVDKMLHHVYPLPPASQKVIEHYFSYYLLSGHINWRGRQPDDITISRLAARAGGLLIWAATVRLLVTNKFVAKYPHEILDEILLSEEQVVAQKAGLEQTQLQHLYHSTMSTLFPSYIQDELQRFLAGILVLQQVMSIADFAQLSGISQPVAEEIHQRLAALQTQGDPQTGLVSPALQRFHASFIEFITNSDVQALKAISALDAHDMFAKKCLQIVFIGLLPSYRGKTCTYSQLHGAESYAVKFWPLHLANSTKTQPVASPNGQQSLDLVSKEAMAHWARLFLPSIAARFQNSHISFDLGIKMSDLPYKIAMMIGKEDVTTLPHYVYCLKIAIQLNPLDLDPWKALIYAYETLYQQSQSDKDLDIMIDALKFSLKQANEADADYSMLLNTLGTSLQTRFEQQSTLHDLEEAISIQRKALALWPAPHPEHIKSLNNLGLSLQTYFDQTGGLEDLNEAISMHRKALDLVPAPHPDHSMSLINLANCLHSRFEEQSDLSDLDEAILMHQEALCLVPAPHPNRCLSLMNFANSLDTRFEQQGDLNDLDNAIVMHREALVLCPAPHPDRHKVLINIAHCFQMYFQQQGTLNDINEAISMTREALALCPVPHPAHSMILNNLAGCLHSRFEHQGIMKDLDEAISMNREALNLFPGPQKYMPLNNLAGCLESRFDEQGTLSDLDEAIFMFREAAELVPAPHQDHFSSLSNLANCLQTRFEQQGTLTDLNEAISMHREVLAVFSVAHPNHFSSLINLATCLYIYSEYQLGALDYLNEAISLHQEAAGLVSASHPDHSMAVHAFALALHTRFKQQGAKNDLDEAISMHREALSLQPIPHPRRSMSLHSLADCLQTCFEHQGGLNNLEEAISMYKEALGLRSGPSHPYRPSSLDGLACSLQTRFKQQGTQSDLDEAIILLREAVLLCPASHPKFSTYLKHLSISLQLHFDQFHLIHDLSEMIFLYKQLFDRPVNDPNRAWAVEQLPGAQKEYESLVKF